MVIMQLETVYFLITLSLALGIGVRYGFDKIYGEQLIDKFKTYRKSLKNNLYFHIRSLFHQERKRAEGKISENELEIKINEFIENWIEYQEIKDRYDSILKFRTYFLVLFLLSAGLFITYLINPAFSIGIYDTITMGSVSFGLGFATMIWFIFRVSDLQNSMSKYELNKKSFEELVPNVKNKFSKFIN